MSIDFVAAGISYDVSEDLFLGSPFRLVIAGVAVPSFACGMIRSHITGTDTAEEWKVQVYSNGDDVVPRVEASYRTGEVYPGIGSGYLNLSTWSPTTDIRTQSLLEPLMGPGIKCSELGHTQAPFDAFHYRFEITGWFGGSAIRCVSVDIFGDPISVSGRCHMSADVHVAVPFGSWLEVRTGSKAWRDLVRTSSFSGTLPNLLHVPSLLPVDTIELLAADVQAEASRLTTAMVALRQDGFEEEFLSPDLALSRFLRGARELRVPLSDLAVDLWLCGVGDPRGVLRVRSRSSEAFTVKVDARRGSLKILERMFAEVGVDLAHNSIGDTGPGGWT